MFIVEIQKVEFWRSLPEEKRPSIKKKPLKTIKKGKEKLEISKCPPRKYRHPLKNVSILVNDYNKLVVCWETFGIMQP